MSRFMFQSMRVLFVMVCAGMLLDGCLPELDRTLMDSADAQVDGGGDAGGDTLCQGGMPNGWLQDGEQCDDGNVIDGDGCSAKCELKCDGLVDEQTGHCYFLLGLSVAPNEAASKCAEAGNDAHVVTIRSDRELLEVADWAKSKNIAEFMLGIYADTDPNVWRSLAPREPGWSKSKACPGCFAPWADGQPVTTPLFRAAVQSTGGERGWSTWKLTTPVALVCERGQLGRPENTCELPSCDPAQTYTFAHAGKLYRVEKASQAAWTAEQTCVSWGGHLVTIESEQERELLTELGPRARFWIGLSRKSEGAPWKWLDGVSAKQRPIPWSAREPSSKDLVGTLAPSSGFDTYLVEGLSPVVLLPYVCKKTVN